MVNAGPIRKPPVLCICLLLEQQSRILVEEGWLKIYKYPCMARLKSFTSSSFLVYLNSKLSLSFTFNVQQESSDDFCTWNTEIKRFICKKCWLYCFKHIIIHFLFWKNVRILIEDRDLARKIVWPSYSGWKIWTCTSIIQSAVLSEMDCWPGGMCCWSVLHILPLSWMSFVLHSRFLQLLIT